MSRTNNSYVSPSRPWPSCQDSSEWFGLPYVPLRPLEAICHLWFSTPKYTQLIPGNRVVSTRHVGCPVLVMLHKISFTYLVPFVDKHPAQEFRRSFFCISSFVKTLTITWWLRKLSIHVLYSQNLSFDSFYRQTDPGVVIEARQFPNIRVAGHLPPTPLPPSDFCNRISPL